MRKLAGTILGADEQILKKVYQGTVRHHLEYSSAAWALTAESNLQSLDKVHNQALGFIICPRSQETKKEKQHALALDMPVTPLGITDILNPLEDDLSAVIICTRVPYLEQETEDDNTKRNQTLAMICEQ